MDKDKFTPLHLAAFNGSTLTSTFLLDRGANSRARNNDVRLCPAQEGGNSNTPLSPN